MGNLSCRLNFCTTQLFYAIESGCIVMENQVNCSLLFCSVVSFIARRDEALRSLTAIVKIVYLRRQLWPLKMK